MERKYRWKDFLNDCVVLSIFLSSYYIHLSIFLREKKDIRAYYDLTLYKKDGKIKR